LALALPWSGGRIGVTAEAQTRIRLGPGRTSTSISSSITNKGDRTYVVAARDGQKISANVSSRNGCVTFGNAETDTKFTTDAGDNFISLFNSCPTTSFTLTVTIYQGSQARSGSIGTGKRE